MPRGDSDTTTGAPPDGQRPAHQKKRIREGEVPDVQRLEPSKITQTDRQKLNLWQKRALMIDELGTIPKRGWNDHHKYNFVLESDVVAYLGPLMTKYMVVTTVSVDIANVERIPLNETRSGSVMTLTRLPLDVTFINADKPDERDTVAWIGEGSDTGDKGVYKAYTGALKYLYMKWFLIATGDDPEVFTRTDALTEGRAVGVEELSEGTTQVRRVSGRRQPERGGRQGETTVAQIATLGTLSTGMGLGPRGTAEEIDRILGTKLVDILDTIEEGDGQRAALIQWLKDREGDELARILRAFTDLAEQKLTEKEEEKLMGELKESLDEGEDVEQPDELTGSGYGS